MGEAWAPWGRHGHHGGSESGLRFWERGARLRVWGAGSRVWGLGFGSGLDLGSFSPAASTLQEWYGPSTSSPEHLEQAASLVLAQDLSTQQAPDEQQPGAQDDGEGCPSRQLGMQAGGGRWQWCSSRPEKRVAHVAVAAAGPGGCPRRGQRLPACLPWLSQVWPLM